MEFHKLDTAALSSVLIELIVTPSVNLGPSIDPTEIADLQATTRGDSLARRFATGRASPPWRT